jgi:hypothetical protein
MPTLSASEIKGYAVQAGITGQNATIATAIALAESGGDTDVTHVNRNGSTDYGLWQINSVHSALLNGHNWRDPSDNAAMMFSISNGGKNWSPWSTYKSGAYLTHMAAASAGADTSVTGGVTTIGNDDSSFSSIQKAVTTLTDPHLWVRVGEVLGGVALLMVALYMSSPVKASSVVKYLPLPTSGIAKAAGVMSKVVAK